MFEYNLEQTQTITWFFGHWWTYCAHYLFWTGHLSQNTIKTRLRFTSNRLQIFKHMLRVEYLMYYFSTSCYMYSSRFVPLIDMPFVCTNILYWRSYNLQIYSFWERKCYTAHKTIYTIAHSFCRHLRICWLTLNSLFSIGKAYNKLSTNAFFKLL